MPGAFVPFEPCDDVTPDDLTPDELAGDADHEDDVGPDGPPNEDAWEAQHWDSD